MDIRFFYNGYSVVNQYLRSGGILFVPPKEIGYCIMGIVLLAVGYQILAAARANPVEALKGE